MKTVYFIERYVRDKYGNFTKLEVLGEEFNPENARKLIPSDFKMIPIDDRDNYDEHIWISCKDKPNGEVNFIEYYVRKRFIISL